MKKFMFILCAGLSFYARLSACDECVKQLSMGYLSFKDQVENESKRLLLNGNLNRKEKNEIRKFYAGKRKAILICADYMSSSMQDRLIELGYEEHIEIIIQVLKNHRDEEFISNAFDDATGNTDKRKVYEGKMEGMREALEIIQQLHPEMEF